MLKTLAGKHKSTVTKMARRYKRVTDTEAGPRTCFEAASAHTEGRKPSVARFGGIPLKRKRTTVIHDRRVAPVTARHKQLVTRLLTGRCELCGSHSTIHVHQVRKLADLARPGQPPPTWAQLMAKRRRKTLVVCATCHDTIHARRPAATTS